MKRGIQDFKACSERSEKSSAAPRNDRLSEQKIIVDMTLVSKGEKVVLSGFSKKMATQTVR